MTQIKLNQWTDREYICKWDETNRTLTNSQQHKAKKFVDLDLIAYDGTDYWCKPIKGYNKTTHRIFLVNGEWQCTCQYNTTKHKLCSHIMAVFLWIDKRVTK